MPVTGKAKTNEKRHPCPQFSKSCFALKVSHFKTKGSKPNKHPKSLESRDVKEQLVTLENNHLFYHGLQSPRLCKIQVNLSIYYYLL